MLIEFRVKNYKCLRDEQVLSMVATGDKSLRDTNVMPTGIKAAPEVVRSAAIYGPNAGGKSTVLQAMQTMVFFVSASASFTPEQKLFFSPFCPTPFLLDTKSTQEPIELAAVFVVNNVRYDYSFACTNDRFVREELSVYTSAKPQLWFSRIYNEGKQADEYTFSSYLKGEKKSWQTQTRPNRLFLSNASQLNSKQLELVRHYILCTIFINSSSIFSDIKDKLMVKSLRNEHENVCAFLRHADISIEKIDIEEREVDKFSIVPIDNQQATLQPQKHQEYRLWFHHKTEKGSAVFGSHDESEGTLRLLSLYAFIATVLENGGILIFDELEASLHPLLVRKILRLFHDPEINKKGAQLIFTTHSESLMAEKGLFRRDQLWLVEKDATQAASLYSLAEFTLRKNTDIAKGYMQGRFGGIPIVSDELGKC